MVNLISLLLLFFSPFLGINKTHHDFHQSYFNIEHNTQNRTLEASLRADSEHFLFTVSMEQGENLTFDNVENPLNTKYLESYINEHIICTLNQRRIQWQISFLEINHADIMIHFRPIAFKKKLKTMQVTNTFMVAKFPNQQNIVNLKYKNIQRSILLNIDKPKGEIPF